MRKSILTCLCFNLCYTGITLAANGSEPNDKVKASAKPNILLIGVETLRADHVSCLGYSRKTTPTIDKLAQNGMKFTKAMAASGWTMPTNMSVLTALYPGVHKVTDYTKKLPESINTLAGILKRNGYATGGFVSNPTLNGKYGFAAGFDIYDDYSVDLALGGNLFGSNGNDKMSDVYHAMTSEYVNKAAMQWLGKNYEKPFFMFTFYFDPHYDYIPPPPYDTVFDPNYNGFVDGKNILAINRSKIRPATRDLEHIIALYDGEILYTDTYIDQLLEQFKRCGVLENTLIVIFGDHGDEFYEHGGITHGHTIHNEVIHVPLVICWPKAIAQGGQINSFVSQVDIMPTILDYLGIKYSGFMQGLSLRPLIDGKQSAIHDYVFSEISIYDDHKYAAIISETAKLIYDLNAKASNKTHSMASDFSEQRNLYGSQAADKYKDLEKQLLGWMASNDQIHNSIVKKSPPIETPLKTSGDDPHIQQLKALGYIQ